MSMLRELPRDERGGILLYFSITLPVIVAFTGLMLDGSALLHLHSDLQELADASSLAGAYELDGNIGAISRATDKAQHLLSNDPRWSNVARSGVQIGTPTFYKTLNPPTVTTSDANAHFIKVATVTRQRAPIFLPVVGGTTKQTSAAAVAGRSTVACNVQPLMLCNPFELVPSDFHATPGDVFKFVPKSAGGGSGFSPGDFGLIDPPGTNSSGAKTIRNLLSRQNPSFCFTDGVSPRPGQATADVNNGIDVRFNLNPSGNSSGMDLTPAPNVIKGDNSNACIATNNVKASSTCPDPGNANLFCDHRLPDPPPASWTTPSGSTIQIGSGLNNPNTYWQYHHNGANWPNTITTRYQAYCQELGLGSDCQGSSTAPAWTNAETMRPPGTAPYCSGGSTIGDYRRRIISVAIVNCVAQGVRGNSETNLVSNVYADFFVTRPASIDNSIYGEFIQTIKPPDARIHLVVQLYSCTTC